MKQRTFSLLMLSLLALPVLFSGCSGAQKEAQISVLNSFSSTMMYMPNKKSEPEPEPEIYTVKAGDEVEGLTIKAVTEKEITVETYFEYMCGDDYGTTFTVSRGETIRLTEVGLMDADHTYTICYLDN